MSARAAYDAPEHPPPVTPLTLATPPALDLTRLPQAEVQALYVHVPFCFHKCHYCDFYSITRQTPERMNRFVDLMLREAELWRDLDQAIISHNPRLKVARSVVVPFHSIRRVPRCPSKSMMHVGAPAVCGAISSTNAGITRLFRTARLPDSAIRLR